MRRRLPPDIVLTTLINIDMRASRHERLVSAILLAAALIVAGNAWLAFHAEQLLSESEFWVAHTWEVIAGVENVVGLVKDFETGGRGYLITGDPRYLAAQGADRLLPAQLAHLQSLVADNPRQVQRMAEMGRLAARRIAMVTYTVGVCSAQGQAAAFAVVREGAGIAEMEQLRVLSAQIEQVEHELLDRRLATSARARTQARTAVALASALDIVFIFITFLSLSYERNLRQRASESAMRLEKLQAISDVGLTKLSVEDLTGAMLIRLRSLAEIDAVALCEWRQTEVEVTAVNGVQIDPGTRLPVRTGGPLAESGQANHPVRLHGAETSRLAIPAFQPMRSILILPLSISQRVIGLLIVGRQGDNAFRQQDEELLAVVADRIALAIDRTSLYEAERSARRLAEAASAEVSLLNAELEERVLQRTAELEATNRELEAFSYSVSHDLRAPLRSVDGFSVALEEDFGDLLTGDGKHYLARIRAGVQRMGQLIDALLQLSRITRSEIIVEPVDLSALAREVAAELEQQNPDRRLEFVIEPGLSTQGDGRLLRAVFENMLGNAVKFTGRTDQARIEFGYLPERSAFYIRDNGAGFDPQYAKKLFVAFQRLHGEKDFKGSGIGLATVARVIRRHHGTMGAEGEVGKGATFWFTLKAS
jgi:signal transduction histidine kinase/CHASE3 domain sensor protein